MKYLYNGHIAPELPAYSQAEFPYALIVSANADNTALILMLCVNRPYYGINPEDSSKTGVYNTGRMKVYTCTDTDEAWSFSMETENPLAANDDDPGGGVIWTRKDILKTGEIVWMAGSEPVPMGVSESWLRSFKMGLALGLIGAPLPFPKKEPIGFLYGKPSESGSVGLRVGNTVTLYNGAVLPKLPEWDKTAYPIAFLVYSKGATILDKVYPEKYGLSAVADVRFGDSGYLDAVDPPDKIYEWIPYKSWDCLAPEYAEWEFDSEGGAFFSTTVDRILWCNQDIYYADDHSDATLAGTVAVSGSTQIPVTGMVGYSYNGVVLPELPEWDKTVYPYATVLDAENMVYEDGINLFVSNIPFVYNERMSLYEITSASYNYAKFDGVEEWGGFMQGEGTYRRFRGAPIWTNYDLTLGDGSVYKGTEPIPIYE